jgi:hypothetical protein
MGKVIFEFDEINDRNDVELIVARYKTTSALWDISRIPRAIEKGYSFYTDEVTAKCTCWNTEHDEKNGHCRIGQKVWVVDADAVIDEIRRCLEDVYCLLD